MSNPQQALKQQLWRWLMDNLTPWGEEVRRQAKINLLRRNGTLELKPNKDFKPIRGK